jgi:hypothetical protein
MESSWQPMYYTIDGCMLQNTVANSDAKRWRTLTNKSSRGNGGNTALTYIGEQ